jgi:acyl-homoserine lactone acylase PvdQ
VCCQLRKKSLMLAKLSFLALVLAIAIALVGIRNTANFFIGKALYGFSWWHLPKIEGIILLNTSYPIHGNINIVRDKHGIPHIYADQEIDVVFGQVHIH